MDTQSRIELLEEALAEYVARYGFTEKARAVMIRPELPMTELDTAPFDAHETSAPREE